MLSVTLYYKFSIHFVARQYPEKGEVERKVLVRDLYGTKFSGPTRKKAILAWPGPKEKLKF